MRKKIYRTTPIPAQAPAGPKVETQMRRHPFVRQAHGPIDRHLWSATPRERRNGPGRFREFPNTSGLAAESGRFVMAPRGEQLRTL